MYQIYNECVWEYRYVELEISVKYGDILDL